MDSNKPPKKKMKDKHGEEDEEDDDDDDDDDEEEDDDDDVDEVEKGLSIENSKNIPLGFIPKENEHITIISSDTREQDRYLPVANIARIMKTVLPGNAKIAKDAKETIQECVSEFISFITSEASDKCQQEKRKTINGDDLLWAMSTLGFDKYIEPLRTYLAKYRDSVKAEKPDKPDKKQTGEKRKYNKSGGLEDEPSGVSSASNGSSGGDKKPLSKYLQAKMARALATQQMHHQQAHSMQMHPMPPQHHHPPQQHQYQLQQAPHFVLLPPPTAMSMQLPPSSSQQFLHQQLLLQQQHQLKQQLPNPHPG